MFVITENKGSFALLNIPDNQIEEVQRNNEKVFGDISFSQEDIERIGDGHFIRKVNGKFIIEDNPQVEEMKKQEMILHYKGIQKEIREIKAEIEDFQDRLAGMDEVSKKLANARITVLETKLQEKRTDSDSVSLLGIEKYGESIIGEF